MSNDISQFLDGFYDWTDKNLGEQNYEAIDHLLLDMLKCNMPLEILVAALTITRWAKDKLKNRENFYTAVEALIPKNMNKANILHGLK